MYILHILETLFDIKWDKLQDNYFKSVVGLGLTFMKYMCVV